MKTILKRKKAANAIIAASSRWAEATAESLAELLRPELAEGETLPDLELLQQLLGRALARRWQALERSDQAREHAAQISQRRDQRAVAAQAVLYRRIVDLRRLLHGIFGGAACRRLLGIAGRTSRDAVVLLRQADQIMAQLSRAPDDLPPAAFTPTANDLVRWRATVAAADEALRSASVHATAGIKERDAADAGLRRATADFDSVLVRVASMLAGLYAGAGYDQRASAVRPSKRRLGWLLEDDARHRRPKKRVVERDSRLTKGEPRSRTQHTLRPSPSLEEPVALRANASSS